jgi:putative SOS response-associated peptidase YedK
MCGRFALAASMEEVCQTFGVDRVQYRLPRYNIAPSQEILLVSHRNLRPTVDIGIWGMRRHDGGLLINIRSETAHQKPSFRRLLEIGRCIVPASGFFEWSQSHKRQPYYIVAEDMPLVGLAALYTLEQDEERHATTVRCAILTRAAEGSIAALHHRVPLVVPFAMVDQWLHPESNGTQTLACIREARPPLWRFYPVSPRVGNVANDDERLLDPVDAAEPPLFP